MSNPDIKALEKRIFELEKENSELQSLKNELKKVKSYSDLLFNSTPSAIFTVDHNKTIIGWNRKAEEITGYNTGDVAVGNFSIVAIAAKPPNKTGFFSPDYRYSIQIKVGNMPSGTYPAKHSKLHINS